MLLTPVTRKLGTMVQWARMLGYQVLKLGIEPSLPPAATFASISTSGSRSRTQTDASESLLPSTTTGLALPVILEVCLWGMFGMIP